MTSLNSVNTYSRDNNINFIRLMAAISVTFSHSFPLLTGHEGTFANINLGYFGSMAVAIFFSLSGFLITQSYLRTPNWKAYLKARCLRIFPGLLFANFVTVLLVGLFVKQQGLLLFFDLNNIGYLLSATVFKYYHYSEVFSGLPYTTANGSLWTISIEFRMYLFVLLLGLAGVLRKRILTLMLILLITLTILFQIKFVGDYIFPHLFDYRGFDFSYTNLTVCFILGMIFYLYREKIPLNIIVGLVSLLLCFFVNQSHMKFIFMSYFCFVLAYHPKLYIPQVNFKDDLSYGIYVLSFPVQQILVYKQVTQEPLLLFTLTMMIVIPLSLFSWRFIEKPSLRLR